MTQPLTRLEHDLLGDKTIPADAYYGVQTARALENFQISGVELRLYPDFIHAHCHVEIRRPIVIACYSGCGPACHHQY